MKWAIKAYTASIMQSIANQPNKLVRMRNIFSRCASGSFATDFDRRFRAVGFFGGPISIPPARMLRASP